MFLSWLAMIRTHAWMVFIIAAACLAPGACVQTPARAVVDRAPPLQVIELERETRDHLPLRGLLAIVSLADPAVELMVTPSVKASPQAEATLATLDTFAVASHCDVVINTNYFALVGPRKSQGYKAGVDADILGLCVHEGSVISPARSFAGQGDPALVVFADGRARIAAVREDECEGVAFAAAGIGRSETDPDHGGLLIAGGQSTASQARVDPQVRHPRTAAGVSSDGRTLYLLVLDGRQPSWSVGATLQETAAILLEFGAFDAVNLDGGGSSVMLWRDPGTGALRTNRPSGGAFRPVAAGLGIRIGRGRP